MILLARTKCWHAYIQLSLASGGESSGPTFPLLFTEGSKVKSLNFLHVGIADRRFWCP